MDSAEFPTGSLNFHMCDFETTPVLCVKSEVMALIALAIWLGLPQSRKHPVESGGAGGDHGVVLTRPSWWLDQAVSAMCVGGRQFQGRSSWMRLAG